MCYHIALSVEPRQLARRYGRNADSIRGFRPTNHVSAFSHAHYPVVMADECIELFRWGLIPFWTKDRDAAQAIRTRTLNARAETIFEKPSFRDAIRKRRCLIPVTGFYDWRHEEQKKIPFFITVNQCPVFSLAGIYDCWHDTETHEMIRTFSIVTTEANNMMRYIHNTNYRMPVILHPEDEERWLAPDSSISEIARLLRSFPEKEMESRIVERVY